MNEKQPSVQRFRSTRPFPQRARKKSATAIDKPNFVKSDGATFHSLRTPHKGSDQPAFWNATNMQGHKSNKESKQGNGFNSCNHFFIIVSNKYVCDRSKGCNLLSARLRSKELFRLAGCKLSSVIQTVSIQEGFDPRLLCSGLRVGGDRSKFCPPSFRHLLSCCSAMVH